MRTRRSAIAASTVVFCHLGYNFDVRLMYHPTQAAEGAVLPMDSPRFYNI
jgi:hypothetical protein